MADFRLCDSKRASLKSVATILVIGYGNTLRRDDGVGPKVAEAVAALNLPGVQAIAVAQLTPELAEPISQVHVVIFVDAAVDAPREVQLRELTPSEANQLSAHSVAPRTVLALARDVFGYSPKAWWLTIPAEDLGYGEEMSESAKAGFQIALKHIQVLTSSASGI